MAKDKCPYHLHVNWNKVIAVAFFWLIMLLMVSNLIGIFAIHMKRQEIVYKSCVGACSKKHFQGLEIGWDIADNPSVDEFDRTDCIDNCNDLYLAIT